MPVARFQMPDGRVARFEVPEGTSPEQAQTMMEAHFAPAPTRGTVPEEKPSGIYGAIRPYVAPALEAGGAIAGGLIGAGAGTLAAPGVGTAAGGVAGAGLGYGIAKEALNLADVYMGGKAPRAGVTQITEPVENVLTGATMEVGGQLAGKALGAGAQAVGGYYNKLKDLKSAAYLNAVENKGADIVNALRSKEAIITPGSAPTAGEIAAPVGSAKFSALQEGVKKQLPTEYAGMAAQTSEARLAQESRVIDRFNNVVSRIKDKITRGLTDVSPRETGEALLAAAKAEQQTVKKGLVEPAYEKAFKEAGNAKIDVSGVVKTAEDILERKLTDFAPETAPNTVRKLLSLKPSAAETAPVLLDASGKPIRQIAPPAPEATLQQLDDIRKAINADIAAAKTSTTPSADMTLRNLYKLHDTIDATIASSKTLPDTAKAAYSDAIGLYRDVYAPRFKTGVNAQLFKQTSLNEPKIEPDKVIKTFFKPQGEREATQFVDMFGKNPDAMQIARSGIEDLYRQKVVDATTGMVNPAKHAQFIKDYSRPLEILDNAGMNVTTRLDVVGKDAARLARVEEMAKASGNKLAAPLPAGANALAVEKRIGELTKNLTPQQLSAVDAVKKDLLREAEYERLVKAGGGTVGVTTIATEAGKKVGVPFPSLLSTPLTLFNNVAKRLMLRMDSKLAMELARELTNPALAAQSIEKAMAMDAARRSGMQGSVLPLLGRAATTGTAIQSNQP